MSSVTSQWNINGSSPTTVGGTGTTAKYFASPSGNFTSGVAPIAGPSSTSGFGALPIRGDNQLNGQQFSIVAAGNFEVGPGGACPSVTIEMVANTGTITSPTWTVIATTGAITAQTNLNTFYPWQLEATLNGDTQSGTISGYQISVVDNTLQSPAALSSVLSKLNFAGSAIYPGAPVFAVAIRVTFSVSEPGNSANMFEFQVQS